MKELTADQLLIEFRALRTHLDPVLNARMKDVLHETEKRLSRQGKNPESKGSRIGAGMTKEQILNKWLNRY